MTPTPYTCELCLHLYNELHRFPRYSQYAQHLELKHKTLLSKIEGEPTSPLTKPSPPTDEL